MSLIPKGPKPTAFLMGVANVQKVGTILRAIHPRVMSFYGEEHVLCLFFTELAKIKLIQICQ